MAITLYSTTYCPYAWRTRIVLHEKKVPFEVFEVDLKQKQGEFIDVSPTGKVPVLVDDGTTLWESMVVNEYLEETHPDPNLLGVAPAEKAEVRTEIIDLNWNRSQPLAKLAAMFLYGRLEKDNERIERQLGRWNGYLDFLDQIFSTRQWLAIGRFSMADISLYTTVSISHGFGLGQDKERPALATWMDRMNDRDTVRRSAPAGLPELH